MAQERDDFTAEQRVQTERSENKKRKEKETGEKEGEEASEWSPRLRVGVSVKRGTCRRRASFGSHRLEQSERGEEERADKTAKEDRRDDMREG